MRLILILTLVLSSSIVSAGDYYNIQPEYEIRPKYYDMRPNDGFLDPGSSSNPFVLQDKYGNDRGTIAPKYFDMVPGDGFMDKGTYANPYIYKP